MQTPHIHGFTAASEIMGESESVQLNPSVPKLVLNTTSSGSRVDINVLVDAADGRNNTITSAC